MRRSSARIRIGILVSAAVSATAVGAAREEPMDERIRKIVEGPLVVRVEPTVGVVTRLDVPYTDEGGEGPLLDLYSPPTGSADARAAWIFVHGGPLPPGGGALPSPRRWRFYRDYGTIAASSGRVGVVVGHRYRGLDAIDRSAADVRAAIEWLRSHARELGIDADRLSLWLFSGAGVHLAGWLAAPPAGVRSLVAFYPAVDPESLVAMGAGTLPPDAPPRRSPEIDPLRAPRLLVARAGLDHPALNAALDRLVASLVARGVTLELVTHPQGHHGFDLFDDDPRSREIVEATLRFLVRGESTDEPAPRVGRPPTE